ncbi:MAG: DUF6340 family protein [Tenuifilaceae bacterium]|jgi:hypothetical protein|nr:DUF6340 family protein [Tenuifilaceae bacterium]
MKSKYINNRLFFLSFVLLALTFSSCVQYRLINIQTLKPAELAIPNNFIQPLVVVGTYEGIQGVPESMAQASLDSTAAIEAGLVLAETLAESPWFDGIEVPVKQHYRDDSSHLILPYPWKRVEEIAAGTNADLVISLEYIKLTPKTSGYPFWDGAMQAYYGYLSMNVYAYWRVYDLYQQKVYSEHLYRDTLTWEETDYYRVRVGDQLPGFFSAATYCGFLAGQDYAKRIAPSWMDEQRVYFVKGPKPMKVAAEFAQNNQWLDAAAQWQVVLRNYENRSQVAAKAAFNMAVANEILGSFDVALEWLNQSESYYVLPEASWYRKIIEHRIKLLERL